MISDIRDVFTLLVDFSFKKLITPLIVRVLYRLGILVAFLCVILQIANAFAITEGRGFLMLFFGFIVLFPFYVMVLRIVLEIVMALFYKASGTPIEIATGLEPKNAPVPQEAPVETQ